MGIKLHLGSGGKVLQGWHNLDMRQSNTTDAGTGTVCRRWNAPILPYGDGTVDFVHNEHFLEHIDEKDGFTLLREVYRVLKPGGILRTATPSMDRYVDAYLNGNFDTGPRSLFRNGNQFLNFAIYGEAKKPKGFVGRYLKSLDGANPPTFPGTNDDHLYIYSEDDYCIKLSHIGFHSFKRESWGHSSHPELVGVEHGLQNRLEFIIESTK